MKLLYITIIYLVQPLILIRLLLRSFKIPAYRYRWNERYGFCKNKIKPKGILIHSVSVGETLSVIPLVREIRSQYPALPITITTMTPTGSDRIQSELDKNTCHVYLPYDLPCAMSRFLDTACPKLVIIIETELWPNMIWALHARKIPLIIASARLSERSAKKYSIAGNFICHLLEKITLIAAQHDEDAARFISLGLKRNQLTITGSLKYDISVTPEIITHAALLRCQVALNRPVWIAANTHWGEEDIILQAHCKLLEQFPDLLLILVPRHPERFINVRKIVQKTKLNFILRSCNNLECSSPQVLIGDTMGELMLLYGIADLAFVGGSLIKHGGGHNPLEPAAHSIPILMGPYTFNFQNICAQLHQVNGLMIVNNVHSIINTVSMLLNNKNSRILYGRCAAEVLHNNRGVIYKLMKLLQPYLLQGNH